MTTINAYLSNLSDVRAKRVGAVVEYVRTYYPVATETLDYSPKWKYPTFKQGDVYVTIASMKSHISIHFGKHNATRMIADSNPKIKVGVGCVNIRDSVPFPMEDIQKAIGFCFEDSTRGDSVWGGHG